MKLVKAGILVFLVCAGILVSAQKINSPYSYYGLGQLHGKNINTPLLSMGGVSIGMWDPTMVNPGNPASYATFDSTSFLFEAAIIGNFVTHRTQFQTENSNYATLNYVFFGFPVTDWWRTTLGVMPFSKVGYDINVIVPVDEFSDVVNDLSGDGGINRFFWGNGFNLTKNLRVGIDASFLYGQATRSSMVYFPDSSNIFSTKGNLSSRGAGFVFDYGIQYDFHIGEEDILTLGLIYSNPFYVNTEREYIVYTLTGGFNGDVEFPQDTIVYQPKERGLTLIPSKVGFGFMYKHGQTLTVGGDFEWGNWDKFESFGTRDSLNNAYRMALGVQYVPRHTSISGLFQRMAYRIGVRYDNSYLHLLDNDINEYGISFGFGIPLKKSRTMIDLGVEVGRRGTTDNSLIQENFVNISFGVSIFEQWFQKRRYR
jgi:hypothetical protein